MRRHARMTALGILATEVIAAIRSAIRSRAGQRLAGIQTLPTAG